MPRRAIIITLDELPLFAEDREIARAVVGASVEKVSHWLASLPVLETRRAPQEAPGLRPVRPGRPAVLRPSLRAPRWHASTGRTRGREAMADAEAQGATKRVLRLG